MRLEILSRLDRRYIAVALAILGAAFIGGALCGLRSSSAPPVARDTEPYAEAPSVGEPLETETPPPPEPPEQLAADAPPSESSGAANDSGTTAEPTDLRPPELLPVEERPPGPELHPAHGSWSVLKRGRIQQRAVALTIDLGDTATRESVTGILQLLHSHGIHCTWFVTGWFVDNFPDLSLEIQQSGHDLGNHTVTHPYCTSISPADLAEELEGVEDRLAQHGLVITQPKYFRPPYGAYNTSVVGTARELGYRTVMWSATSTDYDLSTDPQSAARAILDSLGPGGIILTHATPVSHAMIPTLLDELEGRGYDIVSLQDVIDIAHGQVVF